MGDEPVINQASLAVALEQWQRDGEAEKWAASTDQNRYDDAPASTCSGGPLNATAYWEPSHLRDGDDVCDCDRIERAMLAFATQPPGYKLVPVEPTEAMIEAGHSADAVMLTPEQAYTRIWSAMIEASPTYGEEGDA